MFLELWQDLLILSTKLWISTMGTPTFHTWNFGLSEAQHSSLYIRWETKQGCTLRESPAQSLRAARSLPCYLGRAFSSRSWDTKLWRLLNWPTVYLDCCMTFTRFAHGQHFTLSAINEQHWLQCTFQARSVCNFKYWAMEWERAKVLDVCMCITKCKGVTASIVL